LKSQRPLRAASDKRLTRGWGSHYQYRGRRRGRPSSGLGRRRPPRPGGHSGCCRAPTTARPGSPRWRPRPPPPLAAARSSRLGRRPLRHSRCGHGLFLLHGVRIVCSAAHADTLEHKAVFLVATTTAVSDRRRGNGTGMKRASLRLTPSRLSRMRAGPRHLALAATRHRSEPCQQARFACDEHSGADHTPRAACISASVHFGSTVRDNKTEQ
jgi:hypothetical protein